MRVLGVFVIVAMTGVVGVAAIAGGAAAPPEPDGAGTSIGDIPSSLVGVYVAAAGSCPGLPWSVLAAIGSIESRHGEGRVDPSTGDVLPPILGPALDGRSGFARIPDPQSGDGWAHAEGPMQFLPDTWRRWGRLAPGRPTGIVSSPNNAWDAIWTAAAYLCGSVGRVSDVRAAIRSFNHSDAYVNKVLAKAAEYEVAVHALSGRRQRHGLPCDRAAPALQGLPRLPRSGGRLHEGNDLIAPYGTVLVAIEDGIVDKSSDVEVGLGGITLWIRGSSGTHWYYAHNSRNLVTVGRRVVAGQPVALLGNTGDARTTTPHLHLEMHPGGGAAVDPFPLIEGLCVRAT